MRGVARSLGVVLLLATAACSRRPEKHPEPLQPEAPPVIEAFGATPPMVVLGSSSTLSWSVTGATSVTIDPGVGDVDGTSVVVTPAAATTYTLTAANGAGSATATVTVGVVAPPRILSFTATPSAILPGASVTLAWSVADADRVELDGGVVTGDRVTVVAMETTTHTLTASSGIGTATAQVTVTVLPWPPQYPPSISSFTANPPTVEAGGSAVLSWWVASAAQTWIDPGIGPVASTGTVVVAPERTTTYRLSASNALGSRSAEVTVVVPAPWCGNASGAYPTPATVATTTYAGNVVAADFTGDGRTDLAVVHQPSNSVGILGANGDGTFVAALDSTVTRWPWTIAAGDLDGDGRADVVVSNPSPTYPVSPDVVSVFLTAPGGALGGRADYATGHGPAGIAVVDLDGDARRDLVVANWVDGTVSVLRGRGDGTFWPAVDHAAAPSSYAVAAGDLDRDGSPDVVVASTSGTLVVLLGDGAGGFRARADYAIPTSPYVTLAQAHPLAVADLDGDGALDVVVASWTSTNAAVTVLLNRGDGTFQSGTRYTAGTGTVTLAVADVDGDGAVDLVVVTTGRAIEVWPGDGRGGFGSPVTYGNVGQPLDLAVADLDGDGKPDLAAVESTGLVVYLNGCRP